MQSDSFTTYIHSKVKAFQMALISIEQKRRKTLLHSMLINNVEKYCFFTLSKTNQ